MSEPKWQTAISHASADEIRYRGYRLEEIIHELDFVSTIALLVQGDVPTASERRMLDAMFMAVTDHGVSLSQGITRYVIACGSPLQASIAAGILTIGDHHAGAGTAVANLFEEYLTAAEYDSLPAAARALVDDHLDRGAPVPGYGHPTHTGGDPRARVLEDIAMEEGIANDFVRFSLEVEDALANRHETRIPINIDGISAAILRDMGFPATFARAYLIIGRVPGLVAHALEELDREDPYRLLGGETHYDGPPNQDFT